ncbi:MAG: hypothetical protein A2756_05515 [Candidatus Ryanbacteria bacterium RIFCSPHIGHO2_01_FULL_48_27]|uniref:Crotonobetainyl-CoA--carnitine CoA-transferase n=1 Tax=Candidatus Ryanbacteria bacterium RIFCSPHIGHO2_01_FULL_48_27 TaxID=1802115 RepID=A0A1G2G1B5_9BACT|nr:MAG: hypothetical protein A2756_05515 [Candidatus Ryanbacteria bacterium RIFCSPHIGHO2_01_FULL_48_27]
MKFSSRDKNYKSKRAEFAERYGKRELWSVIDQWPLYCGIGNLSRFLAIYEIFCSTKAVPGHVAEFGSWRGANVLFLAKLLRIFDPHGSKMTHCFDSFEGLIEFSQQDGNAKVMGAGAPYTQGSLQELQDIIALYDMQDEIEIHKGFIEKTLPALLEEKKALSFSFVYCDADLYSPTKTVLELVHPRLSEGGVFVFDEWNFEDCPGETSACREFLESHGHMYRQEHASNTHQPTLVLRKIASC